MRCPWRGDALSPGLYICQIAGGIILHLYVCAQITFHVAEIAITLIFTGNGITILPFLGHAAHYITLQFDRAMLIDSFYQQTTAVVAIGFPAAITMLSTGQVAVVIILVFSPAIA